MKSLMFWLMLLFAYNCSGQMPNFFLKKKAKSPEFPLINFSHIDRTISFNERDSIIYTLNFEPDSVSMLDQNNYFISLYSRNSSSSTTVNGETKSTYTLLFYPISTKDFKLPSPKFYLDGKEYITDSIPIKVIHRELTEQEKLMLKFYNLRNTLDKSENTMQIVFNDELGYYCIKQNGRFMIVNELTKHQVKIINKLMK